MLTLPHAPCRLAREVSELRQAVALAEGDAARLGAGRAMQVINSELAEVEGQRQQQEVGQQGGDSGAVCMCYDGWLVS
jgi:hypothetical protein